jgi:AcrR family transcriptional regulator
MANRDWVLGVDRNAEASNRILAAAYDLVSREGFEAFTIDALAAKLHCSPATIYRRAGGKAAIIERLISIFADRIIRSMHREIDGLEGTERIATAILVGLDLMRAEPLGKLIMGVTRPDQDSGAVTASPLVTKITSEMIGYADPVAAQWIIRATFALWYWPVKNRQAEIELVRRIVAPSVTHGVRVEAAQ